MKEGKLTMTCDGGSSEYRLDIRYSDGTYHGGLHCGDTLEVSGEGGEWLPTRVECTDTDWLLVGLYESGDIPVGLLARR